MRPVSVSANGPGSEIERLEADLRGRWRQATRAVMVLLSLHGLPPAQIAELLDCHPATVRRWISRFNAEGAAGLADRPRSGRPRLGGRRLAGRIAALLARPGPWTLPRIRRYLGWPQVSGRTLYRRVRLVAIWRRPKLTARGDPAHDHVVAQIVARLIELPRRSVVLAEDETHLNLLPHVRASWTLRTARPQVPTPGTNRQVTVFGAIEVTTGAWVYRLGRRCAADFIALLDQVLRAFPAAPVIVMICDNDSIHHARKVTAYLDEHPRLELLYGARYSPNDNPAERIWAALKNYVANTAVTWPARLRQIHSFFRARSPDEMLDTAAPWTSPWLPPGYEQNFWNAALAEQLRGRVLEGRPYAVLDEPLCDHLADGLGPASGKTTGCPEAYRRWRDALGWLVTDVMPEPEYDDRIAAVLDHLRATPSPPPSIEDLTRIAHLSQSRLQHLFRDQVGVPIRRYLLWHRYLTALSLLADGASVTRAAHAAGFADSAHLTRTAVRMNGFTPTKMPFRMWLTNCR